MLKAPLEIGRVVRSKAGRDAGREFLVIGIPDETYAYIADGRLRKAETPKKKKRRHLLTTGRYVSEASEKAARGERFQNCEIRKWLQNEEGK